MSPTRNQKSVSSRKTTSNDAKPLSIVGSKVRAPPALPREKINVEFHLSKHNISNIHRQELESLKTPQFDMWKYNDDELMALIEFMYLDLKIINELNVDREAARRFISLCRANYNNNTYSVLNTCNLVDKLEKIEIFSLMVSCLGHDLGHPGLNNAHQINAGTPIAKVYNDQAPLENMHSAILFQILSLPEANILANFTKQEQIRIRSIVIRCILGTDMNTHKPFMEEMKKLHSSGFSFADSEHRTKLVMLLLKCCDISNEVRPTQVADRWVDCLLQEFFNQGDLEKQIGLPVNPLNDRNQTTKPKSQIGFIQFVLIPSFDVLSMYFPETIPIYLEPLHRALEYYKGMQS